MDKTTKFLLGLIAVGLIAINIQLYDGTNGVIKPAHAAEDVWINGQPISVYCTNCN